MRTNAGQSLAEAGTRRISIRAKSLEEARKGGISKS